MRDLSNPKPAPVALIGGGLEIRTPGVDVSSDVEPKSDNVKNLTETAASEVEGVLEDDTE